MVARTEERHLLISFHKVVVLLDEELEMEFAGASKFSRETSFNLKNWRFKKEESIHILCAALAATH